MSPNLNNPKEISNKGEKIYKACYGEEFKQKYPGQFVAINIMDGSATIGETPSNTLIQAKKEHPDGLFT